MNTTEKVTMIVGTCAVAAVFVIVAATLYHKYSAIADCNLAGKVMYEISGMNQCVGKDLAEKLKKAKEAEK